jgi:RecA-family ATPase
MALPQSAMLLEAVCPGANLVSLLLKRLEAGGQFLGQAVRAAKVLVISEEPRLRGAKHRFGDNVRLICQPFQGRRPTQAGWEALVEHVIESCHKQGIELVVIDTLARFLPGSENDAGRMLEALAVLERLTAAVLLLYHPRKAVSIDGYGARGTGCTWVAPPHFRAAWVCGVMTLRTASLSGTGRF